MTASTTSRRTVKGRLDKLADGEGRQASCLHLSFYLANLGMLRGSSELLQRSVRADVSGVEAFISAPAELSELDADGYSDAASCHPVRACIDHGDDRHVPSSQQHGIRRSPTLPWSSRRPWRGWSVHCRGRAILPGRARIR